MGALPASLEVRGVLAELEEDPTSQVLYLQGLATAPEEILITSGAQQAIFLRAIACLRPGTTAVIENPTYPGALDALHAVGARIASLPVDEGAPTPVGWRTQRNTTSRA
jgi:DNA-binding transcriptional MocR family regulator